MNEYKSSQVNELFAALAKAQAEMQNANVDADNPFFKSKYATLSAIVKSSRPALAKHGLSITQPITTDETGQYLTTLLGHLSGQWIESRMKLTPQKTDPQSLGSYITYCRKYAILAICGIAVSDKADDDGEEAMVEEQRKQPQQQYSSDYINEKQVYLLRTKMKQHPDITERYLEGVDVTLILKNEFNGILSRFPNI